RLTIRDSKGATVIEAMHPSKRTATYQVVAGETPPVVEALDLKGPDGKPLTSEIKIPAGVKRPLLVIHPAEKAGTGLRLIVLEDDVSNFEWGSTRFINATDKKMVFTYEKQVVELPPSMEPVQTRPGGASRNIEVKFFFIDRPSRPFYSSIWEHDPELRMLVFLGPGSDPRMGPVAMKMIPEDRRLINAAAEAAKAANGSKP
ncbi:MAG: hypothetical protein ABI600_05700, partial [Luteolibacter sp.]